jgi:hypothetical protein
VIIIPRGSVPSALALSVAVAVVMLLGVLLDAVSIIGAAIVWVASAVYALYAYRVGSSS